MNSAGRTFFHISPDGCGQERLAQIFCLNGYGVLDHEKGALASEMLMARAQGRKPLAEHPEITLFTGLYRVESFWRPPLEAWRAFEFLDQHYPDACFILTTRDPDSWLLDRMTRDSGIVARCYSHHLDQPEDALPDIWRRDWGDHLAAVDAFFGDSPRLVRVDMERESPGDFAQRLSPLLPGSELKSSFRRSWLSDGADTLEQRLAASMDLPSAGEEVEDPELVEDIAAYCLKGLQGGDGPVAGVSTIYCEWDGKETVTDPNGKPLPYAIDAPPGGERPVAILRHDLDFKWARAEGAINDILRLGRRDRVQIDMQDARHIGAQRPLSAPVLCYNRQQGAQNVVLWPLPGMHEIAAPGQPSAECSDIIPFDDKQDRLVWRGHISGSTMLAPEQPRRPSHQLLDELREAGEDRNAQEAAFARLCDVPRMDFLRRFSEHPDIDAGLVLAWRYRDMATHPLLAPYVKPRSRGDFFNRFRYQLNLAGYDHGSNFIGAIDSNSVLLKEEDGWQVYYLGRFKPWVHYIPVALYCADLEEKLAWARANPERCKQMSQAARAEVRRLANPLARRQIMNRILDGLAEARREEPT